MQPYLEHFTRREFKNAAGDWWGVMAPRTLVMMDLLRHRLDAIIFVSPHPQGLGRHTGKEDRSQHNADFWGECRAVDFFVAGVFTYKAVKEVVNAMAALGFTGIGVYTDTYYNGTQHVMFHGDTRSSKAMGLPATWGRVDGEYVPLIEALDHLRSATS